MENIKMLISTDAIEPDGTFDPRYTCDSDNSSPELRWENTPRESLGFALLAEDIDAPSGIFTHWLIYNIPSHLHHLPAGIPAQDSLPNGIKQGVNSFGKLGYAGPCPPIGSRPHRYFFKLYALYHLPPLPSRLQREDFLRAIDPFIIDTANIMGIYQRAILKAG